MGLDSENTYRSLRCRWRSFRMRKLLGPLSQGCLQAGPQRAAAGPGAGVGLWEVWGEILCEWLK